MEKRRYLVENTYQGGYSAFQPPALATSNYSIATGSLGLTTHPTNPNVLQEISSKISTGAKHFEIEAVRPDFLDQVPKQQLEEVRRLAKLTGVDVSVHGPVMDVAGFTQQGFSEVDRELAERKVLNTLERSHELKPDGTINVNFHTAEGIHGSEPLPAAERKIDERTGKLLQYKRITAVNQETGQMRRLDTETRFYPGEEKIEGEKLYPEIMLEVANNTEWDNTLKKVQFQLENVNRIMGGVHTHDRDLFLANIERYFNKKEPLPVSAEAAEQFKKIQFARVYAQEASMEARAAFDKAYKYARTEEDKEKLKTLSKEYGQLMGMGEEGTSISSYDPVFQADALNHLVKGLEAMHPKLNVPVEEFATTQASKTFGNAAFEAYQKYKDKAPTVVIENPPAGFALSTGEDVKNVVVASRKQFVDKAVANGISESEARSQAEKLIGATWDVGHINMLRKYGYTEEEIIKEAEKVAPYVKHVHLSDNFGFEHTELPMGMGNVPLKEVMEKLGQKGFEAKKIIEAGHWMNANNNASPFQMSIEGLGSPIYSTRASPYWSQAVGLQQNYMGGFGNILPQVNYSMFGAGFSMLPTELGGQIGGGQGSRMSGRGME
ncbi:hypothetical protein HYT23_06495 [Candidatus Pacearchaeota archaeon]|nr:hypothetical protein [Candidatus Pacearchaeota archaeon]